MPVTEIESVAGLGEHVGREVAVSDWLEVSQERINQFAEVTEDRQWIHTDPERVARESPFEGTIAHGFLTLSLLSELTKRAMSVGGVRMGINYGLN
ncbi:MAG: MaoC family dehydratase, partial [Pyrinomonadaceae bacterium]|nr:MaoC family dehydratase [Pyrinomonadaceae bacterium]